MFASDPPFDRPVQELSAYLSHMVAQGKVEADGANTYRRKT